MRRRRGYPDVGFIRVVALESPVRGGFRGGTMKRGYIILWRGKRYERYTTDPDKGIYQIKKEFIEEHRIPKKHQWDVSIFLAEEDGETVAQVFA